jgi:hypothetical protein
LFRGTGGGTSITGVGVGIVAPIRIRNINAWQLPFVAGLDAFAASADANGQSSSSTGVAEFNITDAGTPIPANCVAIVTPY